MLYNVSNLIEEIKNILKTMQTFQIIEQVKINNIKEK